MGCGWATANKYDNEDCLVNGAVLGNKSRSGFNLSISARGQEETSKVVTILINLPRQCACDLGAFIVLKHSEEERRARPGFGLV